MALPRRGLTAFALLLDVESGKTYGGVATLEDANALNLKGCVAAVFCRGETWVKK